MVIQEMTKLYHTNMNSRYLIVKERLEKLNIKCEVINVEKLDKEEYRLILLDLIEKTENGFEDIMVQTAKAKRLMNELSFNQMIEHMLNVRGLLKNCLCIGDNGMIISGVKEEDEYTVYKLYKEREMSLIYG